MQQMNAWIDREVVELMRAEARKRAPQETGGVLLGYTTDSDNIVITHAIGPGPNAQHARRNFSPDVRYQERAIADRYRQSRRHITYLGDWHSHPGGGSRLSFLDRRTLRRIRDHEEARAPRPVMAIVHGPDAHDLTIWRLEPRRRKQGTAAKVHVMPFETPGGPSQNVRNLARLAE
jgi:integrative and conjugative element protein (TIGR02256 family)